MPKGIDKTDWDDVHQMACDVANAAIQGDDILTASKKEAMLALLHALLDKYGDHPSIIATIGDYLEDASARRVHYVKALDMARRQHYQDEIEEIEDSLRQFEKEDSQHASAT